MDIEINEVQEIIKNLESCGELSIKEEKYLKVAKLCVQLAAENVGMDGFVEEMLAIAWHGGSTDGSDIQELALKHGLIRQEVYCADKHENCVYDPGNFDDGDVVYFRMENPATYRIVSWIKADGVEEFAAYKRSITEECACKGGHSSLLKEAESAEIFTKQLREGAGK